MPEGDTIHKIAAFIRPRLQGKELLRVEAAGSPMPLLRGQPVDAVRAAGKHLLVCLPKWTLRVHLGMDGDWHRYAPGERWKRPVWQASLILESQDDVFVCFTAKDVECLEAHEIKRSPLGSLGPDLLAAEFAPGPIVQRARLRPPDTALLDVLLDQRVAAGLGNVYKCELLFMHAHHPTKRLDAVTDAQLEELYVTARRLLLSNLGGWRRTTTYDRRRGPQPRAPLYVYGRGDTPCERCGTTIIKQTLGESRRITYWCPGCQV